MSGFLTKFHIRYFEKRSLTDFNFGCWISIMDVEDLRFTVLLMVRMVWDLVLCRWEFPVFSKEPDQRTVPNVDRLHFFIIQRLA